MELAKLVFWALLIGALMIVVGSVTEEFRKQARKTL